MLEWKVRYFVGNMLHSYVLDAETQLDAIMKAINRIPEGSRCFVSDFSVERNYKEWN